MSALELVASLVGSLAWPLVALFAVWLLRWPLARSLSGPVRRWKAGPSGVEIEYWERKVAATREELTRAQGDSGGNELRETPTVLLNTSLQELAEASPDTAISGAYRTIERQLRVRLIDHQAPADLDVAGLALFGEDKGVINQETANAIQGLSVLRTLAAHGRVGDVTPDRAIEFLSLADGVLFALRQRS